MRWLIGHTKAVRALAYAPDGRLVSGGEDRTVRVWDVAGGGEPVVLKPRSVVYAVAADAHVVANAGRAVGSGVRQVLVYLWQIADGKLCGTYEWPMGADPLSLWSVSLSADGKYVAAAARRLGAANYLNGGGAFWWERGRPANCAPVEGGRNPFAVAFAPTGHALAVARENEVAVYDRPGGPERVAFPLAAAWATVAFVPGRDAVVAAAWSFLYFCELDGKARPKRVKTGIRAVTALAATPDGRHVLAGGKPGAVEVYDAHGNGPVRAFALEMGNVHAVAAAPDGLTFAAAGDGGPVVVDLDA